MLRALLCLSVVLFAAGLADAAVSRKLLQVGGTITLPAPLEEYPPGVGTGIIGGAVGGVIGGNRGGQAAALAALAVAPTPEGEEVYQTLPTPEAEVIGGVLGSRQGSRLGAALGAGYTAELVPAGELVTLAPQVEVPAETAGALIGSAVGSAVGASTGQTLTGSILAPQTMAPGNE